MLSKKKETTFRWLYHIKRPLVVSSVCNSFQKDIVAMRIIFTDILNEHHYQK